jgi:hypothetical protein
MISVSFTQRREEDRKAQSEDSMNEVSTGSGSDRLSGDNKIELARSLTRSLPLPVLASWCESQIRAHPLN